MFSANYDGVWQYGGPKREASCARHRRLIAALSVTILLPLILVISLLAARNKEGSAGEAAAKDQTFIYSPTPRPFATSPTERPQTNQSSRPMTSPKQNFTPSPIPVTPSPAPRSVPPTPSPVSDTTALPLGDEPEESDDITYAPGHLEVEENGLLLSKGLKSRIIAVKNQKVDYVGGGQSTELFHRAPDFGATFPVPDDVDENRGGWVYASNSEIDEKGKGGVGAITFDKDGNVIRYGMVLKGTTMNCGGGRTPWNTWVSCEEVLGSGEIYQVDPFGKRKAEKTVIGEGRGRFESFTYDDRDRSQPRFFASEDRSRGALRRFTPYIANWNDPWTMLHSDGALEYLVVEPAFTNATEGRFRWTSEIAVAKINAANHYPESEGIDREGNHLYMVCKREKWLFVLNLDDMTYKRYSTEFGVFDGSPDSLKTILDDHQEILYFTEEQGENAGIHGRNSFGQFFTIMEGIDYASETTGLSFSPDGMHLYVAFQKEGILFDIAREDGQPFHGKTLNVLYHNVAKVMLR